MARFTFVDYDDDSSVESLAPSDGSCSLDSSIDYSSINGDGFIKKFIIIVLNFIFNKMARFTSVSLKYSNDGLDNDNASECFDEVDAIATVDTSPPPVIAVAVVDIVPPRRSSRSRRKPIRFSDEYKKYYC